MIGRLRRRDEGTSLVIVLIIITVISAVMGVLLSQIDTSVRTTVVLRDQASDNYAADAAAHALMEQLSLPTGATGKITCDTPAGTYKDLGSGSGSSAFYQPIQTTDGNLNAAVSCAPDTANGVTTTTTTTGTGVGIGGSNNNLPSYALLTMRKNSLTTGITFPQSNKTICIENGKVASNATINANNNLIDVQLSKKSGSVADCSPTTGSSTGLAVQAYGSGGSGGCLPNKTSAYKPTNCTDMAATIGVPTAPAPSAPITRTNQAAVCKTDSSTSTTYAAFQPGLYTNVALLNSPCGSGADFEWFSPGTYYFDFGSTTWQWPATLLGGTPTSGPSTTTGGVTTTPAITSVDPTKASTLPGLAGIAPFPSSPSGDPNSCADPSAQSQYPGVEFVFGGTSTFAPNVFGNAELCGTYDANNPPIAVYGAFGSGVTVSGGSVSAEALCTGPSACSDANPTPAASLINLTTQPKNGHAQFYIKGFVYAPYAPITLSLKNSNGQIFNWGVVVWTFSLDVNGSSPGQPFIELPNPNQGFTQTTTTTYKYRYIKVWICPASSSTCDHSGPADLVARVQYTGTGIVKILSWSHAR